MKNLLIVFTISLLVSACGSSSPRTPDPVAVERMCDQYEYFARNNIVLNDKRAEEVYFSDEFRDIALDNGFTRAEMLDLCKGRLN
jgi:hypothetical protein